MGVQADYSHEVAREIDEEVRNLIEAAHNEAWAILNEYRDVLDLLATALLERETLHRKDLEAIFTEVEKRPRITAFNDFGERTPSDKPPVKTPRELATERGEPWPPPEAPGHATPRHDPVPANHHAAPVPDYGPGAPVRGSRPDYGAPAGWSAPGWPPLEQQPGAGPPEQHGGWAPPSGQHGREPFQPWGSQPNGEQPNQAGGWDDSNGR
jgi:cell division protease FtsH